MTDNNSINNLKEKAINNLLYKGEKCMYYINDEQYSFENIRELKLYINSILVANIITDSLLNKKDSSSLQYIRSVCPKLYYEIWNNEKYFVSYDRKYNEKTITFNYETLDKEATQYFELLFKNGEFKRCLKVLENMFPSVKDYISMHHPYHQSNDKSCYNESVLDCRISNVKYFELYFTRQENEFIKINKDVENLIVQINNDSNDYKKYFNILIAKYNDDELRVFSEVLNISINRISITKTIDVVNLLYDNHNLFMERQLFLELDSGRRINIIIADLLSKVSEEKFETFKNKYKHDFKNLSIIEDISYWIDQNREKGVNYKFEFDSSTKSMCNKVLNENVNLYTKKYFKRGNIWSLYRFDKERTQDYVLRMINKENIYLFISDVITVAINTSNYSYYIKKDSIDSIAPNLDIDTLIKSHNKKLTEREKFIRDIYEAFKSGNDESNNRVYRD